MGAVAVWLGACAVVLLEGYNSWMLPVAYAQGVDAENNWKQTCACILFSVRSVTVNALAVTDAIME